MLKKCPTLVVFSLFLLGWTQGLIADEHPITTFRNEIKTVEIEFQRLLKEVPTDNVERLNFIDSALEKFENKLLKENDYLSKWKLGIAYVHMGHSYLAISKESAEAKTLAKSTFEKAVAHFDAAVKAHPEISDLIVEAGAARVPIAEFYLAENDKAKARKLFIQARETFRLGLENKPHSRLGVHLAYLLLTCKDTDLQDPTEALKAAEKGLKLSETDVSHLSEKQLAKYQANLMEMKAEAMKRLEKK